MEFFDVLVRFEVSLWNAVDAELASQRQVGLGRLHALRAVERHRGRGRVQDLSDDIGITVGAASKLVDRLERDGLVVRQPNPDHKRSPLIALTPEGRAATHSGNRVLADMVGRLVIGDANALTATLRELQDRLDGQHGAVPA